MPSSTRNQPRWWLETPEAFGQDPKPVWKKPREGRRADVPLLQAAMVQHACFVIWNAHVKMQRTTWRKISADLSITGYAQLMRVVRGESTISLVLLAEISALLGPALDYSDEVRHVFGTTWPIPQHGRQQPTAQY